MTAKAEGNRKSLSSPVAKVYDGSTIVAHPIQEGQTLSSIAQIYLFSHWKPIWIYNTEIQKSVGSDPSFISKGTTIFIPRSKLGYARLIAKLEATSCILLADAESILATLEGDWYALEADKVIIDTTAEVFKTTAGLALKAAQAAQAARAAANASRQARIAAYHAMRTESRLVAADLTELASKRMKTAKDLATKSADAASKARTSLQRKTVGTAAKVGDAILSSEGLNTSKTYTLNNAYKAKESVRKLTSLTMSVNKLLDVSEIVLDWVKPTMIADAIVRLSSGEWVETTYKNQRKNVLDTAEAAAARISERAKILQNECDLLYG